MTAFEERPHSPVLRSGRRDAAVPDPPRRVRALDRRPSSWCASSSPKRAPRSHWIDEYGDRDGDGYVEYERRNPETGLENQCWKDSWDSILFADGSLATLAAGDLRDSRATSTTRRCRCARLAREVWGDPAPRRAARTRGGRAQAPVQRGLLDRRPRHTSRWPSTARSARSTRSRPTSAICSGAASSTRTRRAGRAAPDGRPAVLGLGRADDGRGRGRRTTPSGTTSAPSGRTTTR